MTGSRFSKFLFLDKRSAEYSQGYRAGVKASAAWLHEYSETCGAKARANVRTAVHQMSIEAKLIMAGDCNIELAKADVANVFSTKFADVWPDDRRVDAMLAADQKKTLGK